MYIKAFSHDDDIIFYFDGYDNKYVAKGGTLAWRTNNPDNFLNTLCQLTHLKNTVKLSSFSKKKFQTLIWGLKQLSGFASNGTEEFYILPKITARFYSENAKVETYLVGSDQFLTKAEAIHWVETHRLDAVIVHKSNGSTYLRFRPGHHLNKILRWVEDQERKAELNGSPA